MKRVKKGNFGYIKSQKMLRFLRSLAALALPLAFFIVGMILNKGDRKSIYTLVAVVGSIPACMSITGMLMMWMRKPMEESLYQEISSRAGQVTMAYELYLTTYEKNLFLDATAICGEHVACFTHEKKESWELKEMEKHLRTTILNNGYKVDVKIFDQKKAFLDRLDTLRERKEEFEAQANENFKPYDKYPELSRNEVVRHLMMAISL
ncbi:MAG: hypothetical protein Q4B85_01725 [Lachnospiraceae bacterium]|nr:hypothetical protein [Lachnospiraceae bacterium]